MHMLIFPCFPALLFPLIIGFLIIRLLHFNYKFRNTSYNEALGLRIVVDFPIQIVGLVSDSQIKIFSVSGRLVSHLPGPAGTVEGNNAYWYGTDDGGNLVPSGVYIVLAYSSDGSQSVVGKIAVVR